MIKKASNPELVAVFEEIPNVGPSIAANLTLVGLENPSDLKECDPYELYALLCKKTKSYHDPCVLDVFIAAKNFMMGNGGLNWWDFTKERKENFDRIRDQIENYK